MLNVTKSSQRKVCVAFIDLDGCKGINDTCGHVGGGEFGGAAATDDAEELKQRLTAATQGAIHLGEIHFAYAGPSIGVVLANDDERDT